MRKQSAEHDLVTIALALGVAAFVLDSSFPSRRSGGDGHARSGNTAAIASSVPGSVAADFFKPSISPVTEPSPGFDSRPASQCRRRYIPTETRLSEKA